MLIGLTGKAGSGKDTVADMIQEMYPNLQRYSFASPIYELAERWLGLTEGYYHRDIKETEIVIDIDDESFLCLDIFIWEMFKDRHEEITPSSAKACAQKIINHLSNGAIYLNGITKRNVLVTSPRRILQVIGTEGFRETITDSFWVDIAPKENVIISDVRFENEAKMLQDNNGYTLVVNRPTMETISENSHASEAGFCRSLTWDDILNDGSLQVLEDRVRNAMASIEVHFDGESCEW